MASATGGSFLRDDKSSGNSSIKSGQDSSVGSCQPEQVAISDLPTSFDPARKIRHIVVIWDENESWRFCALQAQQEHSGLRNAETIRRRLR